MSIELLLHGRSIFADSLCETMQTARTRGKDIVLPFPRSDVSVVLYIADMLV